MSYEVETHADQERWTWKFRPGEIVRGRLKIENAALTNVRQAVVQLYSVEYARWGCPRTVYDITQKQVASDQDKIRTRFPLKCRFPQTPSFSAEHSEYYWILDTKVDISHKDMSIPQEGS
jgi:hypothetical protein